MADPFLSIIIPVYNEETRLPQTLDDLAAFCARQSYSTEVVIVENGSRDCTWQIASDYASRQANVRAIRSPLRGKGLAVQRGMLEARGAYRFMCDVDFSMPIGEINRFLPPQLVGADIAIASREAPGSVRYNEPGYRHQVGRIFNWIIRILALPGLQDTQCGFKCFKGSVADELFRLQTISGWSFDVELLFIARQRGYHIVELPIPWYFNSQSKIRVLHDSARMALDLLAIRFNALRGVYARQNG